MAAGTYNTLPLEIYGMTTKPVLMRTARDDAPAPTSWQTSCMSSFR